MKKIFLIFKREYLTRVRTKSFLLTTILVPLGFVLLLSLQIIIMLLGGGDLQRIAVKDESGFFVHAFKDLDNLHFKIVPDHLDSLKAHYRDEGKDFDGILHIPPINIDNPNGIRYISDKPIGLSNREHLRRELEEEIKKMRLERLGVSTQTYQQAQSVHINISETGTNDMSSHTGAASAIGFFMGFLMYLVIFIYGMMVMKSVMEEKTNRIVEVILSSVKPFELMMGKIVGVGLVGLTQFSIWFVILSILNITLGAFAATLLPSSGGFSAIPQGAAGSPDAEEIILLVQQWQSGIGRIPFYSLLLGFIYFFIFGYIIYAALYAAVASAMNDDADSQTLSFPISIPIILSIFILSSGLEHPTSSLIWWSSMFPLTSPILMPFRIAFGVPWYELLLSMIFLFIGSIGTVWLAAKIYRTGILLYGKKITLREIGKWILR